MKKFGIWNIYHKLAGGDVLKYSAVEKIEMPIVITHLLYEAELSAFNKRYIEASKKQKRR